MNDGVKRTEVRLLLAKGETVESIASRLDMALSVVQRIAVVSGLGGDGWRLREPDAVYKPSAAAQQVLDAIGWSLDERVPDRRRCSRRDAALCESLILEDITLDEAGASATLTRERARQILLEQTGLSVGDLNLHRTAMREAQRLVNGTAIALDLARTSPDLTIFDLASTSGLTVDEVIERIGTEEALRRRRRNTWASRTEDDVILAELQRVSRLPGGAPLTAPFYDSHRSEDAVSAVRITQRYTTWTAACEAAGVPFRASRRNYGSKWTDDEIVGWVRAYLSEAGARPSFSRLTTWLRTRKAEGAPSAQMVRNRLGKWDDVLSLALDGEPRDSVFSTQGNDTDIGLAAFLSQSSEQGFLGLPAHRWTKEETETEVLAKARLEQAHLRRNLLGDRTTSPCAFCGWEFPTRLLVAAHIVPRRYLTDAERRRFEEIAILACIECDALFEWGYLVVSEVGTTQNGRPAETDDLRERIERVAGSPCHGFSPANAPHFRRHRLMHDAT